MVVHPANLANPDQGHFQIALSLREAGLQGERLPQTRGRFGEPTGDRPCVLQDPPERSYLLLVVARWLDVYVSDFQMFESRIDDYDVTVLDHIVHVVATIPPPRMIKSAGIPSVVCQIIKL